MYIDFQEGERDQLMVAKWESWLTVGGFKPAFFTPKGRDLICLATACQCCSSCLNACLNTTTKAANNENSVTVVYFDMTKSFDRVFHRRLIGDIKCHETIDRIRSWLTSYLSSGNQAVQVNGYTSHQRPVINDVIQGNLLGPTVFCAWMISSALSETVLITNSSMKSKLFTSQPEAWGSSIAEITQDLTYLRM